MWQEETTSNLAVLELLGQDLGFTADSIKNMLNHLSNDLADVTFYLAARHTAKLHVDNLYKLLKVTTGLKQSMLSSILQQKQS